MKNQEPVLFADKPDIVTLKEMQEMLGIGKRLAYKLLHSGKTKGVKVGHVYRIPNH
ncbi:helix-turn-helix domain-containing protein [Eubacterium callanderi]|uniref:Helix-turn-helix domain-containing protein n=1 Tax=Eubacterium limosum TaxID=1736 RepID=A0A6N3HAN5_EUBLI|nr:helix-turn-helix domain-containing protein [Eubacterium callanderi]